MSDLKMITMWRGMNIDDMTRDEAIEALHHAVRLMQKSYQDRDQERRMWTEIRAARAARGLAA